MYIGGHMCTDSVDVRQTGDDHIGGDTLAIIPHLNFTCNGRITSIRARLSVDNRTDHPFFQVWWPSADTTAYDKIGEVELSDDQVTGSGNYQTANIILTGNNTIEVHDQSGDVVGYYHPHQSCYRMRTIKLMDIYYISSVDRTIQLISIIV